MKRFNLFALSFCVLLSASSCFKDNDDDIVTASEINDFIWKGMNIFYLYKSEKPDLANDRFSSDEEYANYLNSFNTPESLFESLLYLPENVDKFSRLIDNYLEFEQSQQGTSLNDGLEYRLYLKPGSETDVFGVVSLVIDGGPAAAAGFMRGQYFDTIDGVQLTTSNLASLLLQDSFTVGFANYDDNGTEVVDDDSVISNGESTQLNATIFTENPVHKTEVLNIDGQSIGYIMYNGFTSTFNNQLNEAFATLKASNVDHLVLDLRYNPGGSVQTAAYLGSMVTGQFSGDVFSKLIYNETLQEFNRDFLFTNTIEDGGAINSLGLNKVYVLTTNRLTASASELVINSLRPYIDVVVIGENTVGKTQASITLYDSENFSDENINPNHLYAMQPLVANSVNVNEDAVPSDGLTPSIQLSESPRNFGVLGNPDEPLLAEAIADITGAGRFFSRMSTSEKFKDFESPEHRKEFIFDLTIEKQ